MLYRSQSRTLTSTASLAPLFVNAIAGVGNSTTTYNGRVKFGAAGTVGSYLRWKCQGT